MISKLKQYLIDIIKTALREIIKEEKENTSITFEFRNKYDNFYLCRGSIALKEKNK